ncbi:MAG: phosphate acyltransferase PlsX [Chromatiales bacterium]|nr:phosphate acyltransferase PlsX [Chromatiales bacterium]
MPAVIRVAVDAMGGDCGPPATVPAALDVLARHADLELLLVGREDVIREQLGPGDRPRVSIVHASEVVSMDDLPSHALRKKKDSSMRVAINLVQDGRADACVSAGNTGALMATARFVLKTLPGIDRPAIMTALPTTKGCFHMLDLGANVDSTAEHLFQFAVMGSELVTAVHGLARPRVGLLNIGEEEIKGNDQVKHAHELLSRSNLNYVGFVEGDRIYTGAADVVVCDGFVGNVALKSSEGVAKMIAHFLRESFTASWLSRLSALAAMPSLKRLRDRIDPRHYNGASLLGLKGIVIKSHGSADRIAFANAIRIAMKEVRERVPERIGAEVAAQLATAGAEA